MKNISSEKNSERDLFSLLEDCRLCPWSCGVNRLRGETGRCGAGDKLKIAAHTLHFGEEPPISGRNGSGTVFFSHCNSFCVYCQNYPISQIGYGNEYSLEDFTGILLSLQGRGAHNINLVSPVPYTPLIKIAVDEAKNKGLKIPILMNLFGWETEEFAELTSDFVDVYLIDIRYSNNETANKYSGIKHYTEVNEKFLKKINEIRPSVELDENEIITKGLIIRHLIIPGHSEESIECLDHLKGWVGNEVHLSLMNQYFPAYNAFKYPEINRKITREEWERVLKHLENLNFKNGWIQDFE